MLLHVHVLRDFNEYSLLDAMAYRDSLFAH